MLSSTEYTANKRSTRASLGNQMRGLTNNSKLHNQKLDQSQVILAKLGPGRVFGEMVYVVPEFQNFQPYTIKCISIKGELLRISGIEFKKKFLSNKNLLKAFTDQSI
jgi:hypothetical protein